MVSSTIAGAEYGLTLVWALAAGVVLKFAITEGAARWQLGTGTTLVEGWRFQPDTPAYGVPYDGSSDGTWSGDTAKRVPADELRAALDQAVRQRDRS